MAAEPEYELDEPLEGLAGDVVAGVGLDLPALLREQVDLREHAGALQVQRESPRNLRILGCTSPRKSLLLFAWNRTDSTRHGSTR
jgi:hypothetical protein